MGDPDATVVHMDLVPVEAVTLQQLRIMILGGCLMTTLNLSRQSSTCSFSAMGRPRSINGLDPYALLRSPGIQLSAPQSRAPPAASNGWPPLLETGSPLPRKPKHVSSLEAPLRGAKAWRARVNEAPDVAGTRDAWVLSRDRRHEIRVVPSGGAPGKGARTSLHRFNIKSNTYLFAKG